MKRIFLIVSVLFFLSNFLPILKEKTKKANSTFSFKKAKLIKTKLFPI